MFMSYLKAWTGHLICRAQCAQILNHFLAQYEEKKKKINRNTFRCVVYGIVLIMTTNLSFIIQKHSEIAAVYKCACT